MSIDRKMINELLSSHIKMSELQLLTKTPMNLRNITEKPNYSLAKFLFKPFIELEYIKKQNMHMQKNIYAADAFS